MMLPVTDTDRAKTFYSEKLGLDYTGTNEEGSAMYALAGGATLVLLPRPDSTPSESTAMSFEVDDVAAEVRSSRARRRVRGLRHAGPEDRRPRRDLGSDKAAWFKDPDGNVLCVHETVE